MRKGSVLATAQLAGIMGAKRTADLIPLCHPVSLTHVGIDFELNHEDNSVGVVASATTASVSPVFCFLPAWVSSVHGLLDGEGRKVTIFEKGAVCV